jgi:hypothetical protein
VEHQPASGVPDPLSRYRAGTDGVTASMALHAKPVSRTPVSDNSLSCPGSKHIGAPRQQNGRGGPHFSDRAISYHLA